MLVLKFHLDALICPLKNKKQTTPALRRNVKMLEGRPARGNRSREC